MTGASCSVGRSCSPPGSRTSCAPTSAGPSASSCSGSSIVSACSSVSLRAHTQPTPTQRSPTIRSAPESGLEQGKAVKWQGLRAEVVMDVYIRRHRSDRERRALHASASHSGLDEDRDGHDRRRADHRSAAHAAPSSAWGNGLCDDRADLDRPDRRRTTVVAEDRGVSCWRLSDPDHRHGRPARVRAQHPVAGRGLERRDGTRREGALAPPRDRALPPPPALPVLREGYLNAEYAAVCAAALGLLLTCGRLTRELNYLLRQARGQAESAETLLLAGDIAARMTERSEPAPSDARTSPLAPGESLSPAEIASARDALARLIEGEGLAMVVQPIVDVRTGLVHAYEALARFGPQLPTSSPLHWFSLAEELGQRDALERSCLAAALELFARRPHGTSLSV